MAAGWDKGGSGVRDAGEEGRAPAPATSWLSEGRGRRQQGGVNISLLMHTQLLGGGHDAGHTC